MAEAARNYEDDQVDQPAFQDRASLDRLSANNNAYEGMNHVNEHKRTELIDALKEYANATGTHAHEEPYIKKIKECKTQGELDAIREKTEKAGMKFMLQEQMKSGIWRSEHKYESQAHLDSQLKDRMKHFADMPLTGNFSKVSTLCRLQEDLKPQIDFRNELKKLKEPAKSQFYIEASQLGFTDSRKEILTRIKKDLSGLEKEPASKQAEFKRLQKVHKNKKAHEIIAMINKQFDKITGDYSEQIAANKDLFGGRLVASDGYGTIREAALEFIEWFKDRPNFADMNSKMDELKPLINERKALYERRDRMLEHLPKMQQDRLRESTNQMRRHTLAAELPKLESYIRHNSENAAVFSARIHSASNRGIKLFPGTEAHTRIQTVLTKSPDVQAAHLVILEDEAGERSQVIDEFYKLPQYLRDDESFKMVSAEGRKKMLFEGEQKAKNEIGSIFEIDSEDSLGIEEINKLVDGIESANNNDLFEKLDKETKQEGLHKSLEVMDSTRARLRSNAERAEMYDTDLEGAAVIDMNDWLFAKDHHNKGDAKISEDVDPRQAWKNRAINAFIHAREQRKTFSSGGPLENVVEVTKEKLWRGDGEFEGEVNRARFSTSLTVVDDSSEASRHSLDWIDGIAKEKAVPLVIALVAKLGAMLGLKAEGINQMSKSKKVTNAIKENIDDEYGSINITDKMAA
ncbi:hypothetical protein HOD30_04720 [Candidatus Peregrinibacteria bacterium]|jgi:hypothetical protein|nr:hypothetical protein [Candidatus Peregrinibacteria bacterium]MBT4632293.1 hypothetical protein [Candidatus Peregrinibacteria bacterium]MBT5516877.1 hypothetical protein [Candidatus Peregrinibacteria bacterium]MBT5824296.1 hypothetical protein [Candidatus Peregrinibacteria bacterium]